MVDFFNGNGDDPPKGKQMTLDELLNILDRPEDKPDKWLPVVDPRAGKIDINHEALIAGANPIRVTTEVNIWVTMPNQTAVAGLCVLAAMTKPGEALHIDDFNPVPKDRNFPQLKRWGLCIDLPKTDPKKYRSGVYRVMSQGRAWVEGKIGIPKYVITFQNVIQGYKGELISVEDVMKWKRDKEYAFDFEQLMRDQAPPVIKKTIFDNMAWRVQKKLDARKKKEEEDD